MTTLPYERTNVRLFINSFSVVSSNHWIAPYMDELNRSVAKRQIARLLGGSSSPTYVLSEDDTLVFANDALGTYVGRSTESLLGLVCSSPIPDDGLPDSRLVAFLSLPVTWCRKYLKVVPILNPFVESPDTMFVETRSKGKRLPEVEWVKCLIPMSDSGAGCTLCVLCQMHGSDRSSQFDEHASTIQQILMESRARYAHLNELWFLQGKSALTRRALEQTQLAIANSYPVTILGPKGSGKTWLAQAIHAHRCNQSNAAQFDGNAAMIRVDCGLMDMELLQSMFELIEESIKDETKHPVVLLDAIEALPEDCLSMLLSFLKKNSRIRCITTYSPEEISPQRSIQPVWKDILLRTGTTRIELSCLSDRLEDLRTLINAWFDTQRRQGNSIREFTDGFVDALCAYPWPNDIEEFADSMRYATDHAEEGESLTQIHLPVNIRTCASHFEFSVTDESVDLDSVLEDIEKTIILRALERFPNNKTSAAKLLNISRARLLRRLQQWGIQSEVDSNDGDDDQPIFNEVSS